MFHGPLLNLPQELINASLKPGIMSNANTTCQASAPELIFIASNENSHFGQTIFPCSWFDLMLNICFNETETLIYLVFPALYEEKLWETSQLLILCCCLFSLALVFRNSFPYTPCRNLNYDLVSGMNKISICSGYLTEHLEEITLFRKLHVTSKSGFISTKSYYIPGIKLKKEHPLSSMCSPPASTCDLYTVSGGIRKTDIYAHQSIDAQSICMHVSSRLFYFIIVLFY